MNFHDSLPDTRVSRGLHKRVVCPVCGDFGTLIARSRGKQWYYYVQHRKGKKIIEHYVGPARLYSFIESKPPVVTVHAKADKESLYVTYTLPKEFEERIHDIKVLRWVMRDYASLLLWLRELIENEIEKLKKAYGLKDEEIVNRLNEIKKEYVTLVLYRKP